MKKIKLLFATALCSILQQSTAQMMYIPNGFSIEQNGELLKFNALSNYTYLGTLENGSIAKEPSATGWVSCTCNSSGTCLPGKYGDIVGCGGKCTNCTLKQGKITIVSGENTELNFISGGFVDFNLGIQLATKNDIGTAGVFDELLNLPEVTTGLTNFINKISNGQSIPEAITNADGSLSAPIGYVLQPILIYGRGCVIVLPESAGNELAVNSSSKTSCSCTKGNCLLKTKLGASYCDGECSGTCKLSWGVVDGESLSELFIFSKF